MPLQRFEIMLFGMGHLRIDGELVMLNRDGLALLADLALADGPRSRDVVIERIWPGASEPDGRVQLRRNLHVINNLLEGAIVRPTPGTLALAPHARNAADCIAFRELARGRERRAEAARLYQADLLIGCDQPAIADHRRRLRAEMADLLEELAHDAECSGDLA
jgi:DNA-binding SARP family transcriptional activator